jgi:excinuclease ABC subunit A
MKLAAELFRKATGNTLYMLDEPTTGLHFEDIKTLLGVLQKLVDQGNTVIIIEHNPDILKSVDWLLDMGPEGGRRGGGGPAHPEGSAAFALVYFHELPEGVARVLKLHHAPVVAQGGGLPVHKIDDHAVHDASPSFTNFRYAASCG